MNNLSGNIPNIPALYQSAPHPDAFPTPQVPQHFIHPPPVIVPTSIPIPHQPQPYNNTQPYVFAQPSFKDVNGGDLSRVKPAVTSSANNDLTFATLKQATYGFDKRNVISDDRFGTVFKGKIDSRQIAVKQMKKVNILFATKFYSETHKTIRSPIETFLNFLHPEH